MSGRLEVDFQKSYRRGPTIEADWQQPADKFSVTVLFGRSGCGKTTALRCVAGLERPEIGVIRCGSDPWFDSQRGINLSPQRRGVSFLFQDYALFPHLTVAGNVGYPLAGRASRRVVADLLAALT